MGVVFCLGIPAASFFALRAVKGQIKEVQAFEVEIARSVDGDTKNIQKRLQTMKQEEGSSILWGVSPLYKDYEPDYWWFEILQFEATLFLCGFATFLPGESASQVAVSLVVSLSLFGTFANARPYLNPEDDVLAQTCQFNLTIVLIVGLLQMINNSDQSQGTNEAFFGLVLIILTSFSLLMGFGLVFSEFLQLAFPEAFKRFLAWWNAGTRVSNADALRRRLTGAPLRRVTAKVSAANDVETGVGAVNDSAPTFVHIFDGPKLHGPPSVQIFPAEAPASTGPIVELQLSNSLSKPTKAARPSMRDPASELTHKEPSASGAASSARSKETGHVESNLNTGFPAEVASIEPPLFTQLTSPSQTSGRFKSKAIKLSGIDRTLDSLPVLKRE